MCLRPTATADPDLLQISPNEDQEEAFRSAGVQPLFYYTLSAGTSSSLNFIRNTLGNLMHLLHKTTSQNYFTKRQLLS